MTLDNITPNPEAVLLFAVCTAWLFAVGRYSKLVFYACVMSTLKSPALTNSVPFLLFSAPKVCGREIFDVCFGGSWVDPHHLPSLKEAFFILY